jgi:hypothetical protein
MIFRGPVNSSESPPILDGVSFANLEAADPRGTQRLTVDLERTHPKYLRVSGIESLVDEPAE